LGPWLWVAGVVLLLGLGGNPVREFLRYERAGILGGELWRLVGGHVVHLGWSHLWLNIIALAILAHVFADVLTRGQWWLTLLLSAAAIDVGLLWLDPAVEWYVGLSGALHGLIVVGGWCLLRGHRRVALALLAGVAGKLAWEQWLGPLPFTAAAAAGPVLVNSHLYGAIGGVLGIVAIRGWAHRNGARAPYNPGD
jgi:rhomboid family GlyGly-CTERM serine protease